MVVSRWCERGTVRVSVLHFLSFFIPLVGLILYFVWKKEKPLRAGSAGKGFVTLVIVALAACVAYFVFIYIMLLNAITDGIEGAFIGGMFI